MPLPSFALVILAAFIHATWNLLSKRAAPAGAGFIAAYTATACVLYAPWVFWLLSQGAIHWSWQVTAFLLVSGALHLGYSVCLQCGYQVAELSVVYPVARGSAPTLSSTAAFLSLGEHPSPLGVVGLVAVVSGIALIATRGDLTAFRRPQGFTGLRWGLATGVLIAAYTVVDAYAVKALSIHPVLLDWFASMVRLSLLAPLLFSNLSAVRERMNGHWSVAFAVGVLSPLSYILVLVAIDLGARLSLVAPAREMSMMVGAFLGMMILRETVGVARLLGCLILTVGVVCLGHG